MSASIWLKSLQDECERVGYDNDLHGERLLMALPQLIAVVEAAERAVRWESVTVVPTSIEDARSLWDALIALREHLEGGDEGV